MRISMLSIAVAAMLFAGASAAQDKAPAGSAEHGKTLFVELSCYSCHGTQGQGGGRGSEPRIGRPIMPWSTFIGLLRQPIRDMPAYTQKWVSDRDVADIYAYLTSLKPSPAAKDIPLLGQQ